VYLEKSFFSSVRSAKCFELCIFEYVRAKTAPKFVFNVRFFIAIFKARKMKTALCVFIMGFFVFEG
jgi:hypothetical protein